ncbi:MAG: beta strand repeat-containing protein [Roseibacillus sp.]
MKRTYLVGSIVGSLMMTVSAVDYTWTGAAADGDWNNTANWTGGLVPPDDNAGGGLTINAADLIIFDGANMPTNNPDMGGEYDGGTNGGDFSTPALQINSGGTIGFDITGNGGSIWTNLGTSGLTFRELWIIGDGTGAPGEVTVNVDPFGNLSRHPGNMVHTVTVNSDGILNFLGNVDMTANAGNRWAALSINGGVVEITGTVNDLDNNANNEVLFTDVGGSFTADYGGDFADLAAVEAQVGPTGSFRSNDVVTITLEVTEDLVSVPNTFTVSAVPAPDPNNWTGNGSGVLGDASNNFTFNNVGDTLDEGPFGDLIGDSDKATFADQYFHVSGPTAVATSTLTTLTGGVVIDDLAFLNDAVSYSINSPDTFGIAGTTSISLIGSGELTLTGEHATSGSTAILAGNTLNLGDGTTDGSINDSAIGNSGALVYNTLGSITQTGALSGTGSIEKLGAGTVTIASGNLSGNTTVTEGNLVFNDPTASPLYTIASNATLTFDIDGGQLNLGPNGTVIDGTGTLVKLGTSTHRWGGAVVNWELDSGALIDVQEGILRGGSNANDIWLINKADLNIGSNGVFQTNESKVRVDSLTGDGELQNGSTNGFYEPLRIGVDNGTGIFDGIITGADGSLIKLGTGTQTLNGSNSFGTNGGTVMIGEDLGGGLIAPGGELILDNLNTYTGDTTIVDGTLTLTADSAIGFVPTANGVSNKVTGTAAGTAEFGGIISIDLSNASAAPGNSWTLVDTSGGLSVSYISGALDFIVEETTEGFVFEEDTPGVWTYDLGFAVWTFTQSTGELTYSAGLDTKFWTGIGGAIWDQATTANFTDNLPTDPVSNVTFDAATTTTMRAAFADVYVASGGSVAATNTTIDVEATGVSTGDVDFFNDSLTYVIDSDGGAGIAGTTNINASNAGTLIFRGDHTTTGTTTIGSDSVVTFEALTSEASTFSSPSTGGGSITKTGDGVTTLAANAGSTGTTTVTAGELILDANHSATAIDIAAGATLTYNSTGNFRYSVDGSYTGTGILKKTGAGTNDWNDGEFALGSGSLIDVQEGIWKGGSGRSEGWSANLSDLNIAAGAGFTSVEANVFVDGVTGEGTLATGFNLGGNPSYAQLTIGVDNGDATFDGTVLDQGVFDNTPTQHFGHLHKVGTGMQTFTGDVALHGDYDIQDGTVTLTDTGSITFFPEGNGVTNQVLASVDTGTPVLNLNGAVNFDLSGADTTTGNMWTVLDPTNFDTVTIGATATVTSSAFGAFTETVVDTTFELDAGGFLWTFDVASATLSVGPGTPPAGYATFQTDFFFPAEITAGDADFDVDFDAGGLDNGIEFVVGGNPTDASDDAALAPTCAKTAGGFTFTFRRTDESIDDNPGVEYGSDIVGFTLAADGVDGVIITITDDGFDTGVDQVDVFLPDSLAVGGKLFARLTVTPTL